MVGAWGFHDHVRDVGQNVNRGLFGGLIVRDPAAACADHQIPLFVHQLAGMSGEHSRALASLGGGTFDHTFATAGAVHYYCAIHGPSMNGTVNVVSGAPALVNVSIKDNLFDPQVISVAPAGTVHWRNDGAHDHIVFSSGGGAANFCLNGRAFIGNTPTIVGETGERLRWYVFNIDSVAAGTTFIRTRCAGRCQHLPAAHPMCMGSVPSSPSSPIRSCRQRCACLAC